jgi:glycosyltransferase involved in cell wall biosynthesis
VIISTQKLPPEQLSYFYNLASCTINIADAEGFGLGTLESLACETPIIVNMTGGLQEQVTDGNDNWFGIGIQPSSKAIIGSQDVPYIYEDRISKKDFLEAIETFYNTPEEERLEMGKKGRKYVLDNYNLSTYTDNWYQAFQSIFDKYGSWDDRKNYKSWEVFEL